MALRRYAVVIETGRSNLSAHIPDMPGCVAAAKNRSKLMRDIQTAAVMHADGNREIGEPATPIAADFVEIEA